MAKSVKKSKAKVAKKPAAKAKSAPKAKKASPVKSKASPKKAAKKVAPKKVAPKKVVAKKAAPKKVVPQKAAPRKAAVKDVQTKTIVAKKVLSTPASRKQEAMAIPKTSPQLTIFPVLTQRPIAHKSTIASTTPEDKTRYSDDELVEFETLIHGKLAKAREEFNILKETLNRNNDAGTDSTSGGNTKVLEDGAETAEKENLSQLAARQLKYITNLENALVRIKNRTYGICTVTGKLIPKERLIAVPHTTQSIEAKMMKQD
jgi:RNA polymerase-binding transcription factor DksA